MVTVIQAVSIKSYGNYWYNNMEDLQDIDDNIWRKYKTLLKQILIKMQQSYLKCGYKQWRIFHAKLLNYMQITKRQNTSISEKEDIFRKGEFVYTDLNIL